MTHTAMTYIHALGFLQVNVIYGMVEFGAEMGEFSVCGHTHLHSARECLRLDGVFPVTLQHFQNLIDALF